MSGQSNAAEVTVIYDEELEPLSPQQHFVLSEFKQYKINSLSVIPTHFVAPNEGIQEREPSVHALFGRDRVFECPPQLIAQIYRENLSHVHYSDGNWATGMSQWSCTSHLAVVYSGFILPENNYHFVVHELLLNEEDAPEFDAHDYYTPDDVEYYVENAKYYREQVEADSE